MVDFFENAINYILNAFLATAFQLFILLGPLLLLAFLMNLISRQNEQLGVNFFGVKVYLYVFAWLGTAIHELGHAIFAIIFGHRIRSISLFSPDLQTGNLGYVYHTYNPNNIYHNLGNFFIGIGPVIIGSACLYLISYLLYGSNAINFEYKFGHESLLSIDAIKISLSEIKQSIYDYTIYVLRGPDAIWWKTVILAYVLFAIGSSISLSAPDVRTAAKGFLFFVIILISFNLATLWYFQVDYLQSYFTTASNFLSPLYLLIIISIGINLIFLVLFGVLNILKSLF